ncbi:hypothetical protein PPL_03304 [Heterostelium album PN500]|uniref:Uncharacterized protein n=1 Tax=Heterostelium pallidum (strain ATCC 26659 / Pp 5 / PN500) TaxID=670386 RepID=D3B4H9_HETP5|nr:hypothetical protein PPL_03304 [Heterostelium album PN500]EFA84227.1 hypothetical protein PPL_03304 [Heterostelium album PN500]|eukprot:XP_020436343.1 hypothetical protein PPL_03304 [Heterostelium album PN500]
MKNSSSSTFFIESLRISTGISKLITIGGFCSDSQLFGGQKLEGFLLVGVSRADEEFTSQGLAKKLKIEHSHCEHQFS